ncbi:magnesium transporter MRS2-5 isoform X3 [Elaeis guineensis]|uniref:Magnesium transporter n=1 Tax=Elaeis guineensis var. tenera TaxID=51953 RepID=A0A6I9QBW4_ELAGV|nr:magnesium transporter MRS2-5 isoform X3 [Elaeis guineensis]
MKNPHSPLIPSALPKPASFHEGVKPDGTANTFFHGFGALGLKKRGHGGRSWIQIDRTGESKVVTLDKATLMRQCGLPARDLRLLDPLFVYPSTILGREKAIVVSLEQIRCIIMADDIFLMNSLDDCVLQYESELCHRLQTMKDQSDNLPFEFKALELALEVASASLDSQVTELEIEIYPVLDELASSISTVNLEHVRRLKSHLLALTHRVQKVRDGIEQLMDDDGDMAEMYLTEKKERMEAYLYRDRYLNVVPAGNWISTSAPVSPTCSSSGQPEKASNSTIMSFSRHESSTGSSNRGRHVEELEMLLEAYFVVTDNTLSKLLSLKEYVDDTEDFINIKLL